MSQTIFLIFVLVLINGMFAAMEMAFVTSRRHRLKLRAEDGDKRAAQVLKAKERPGHYFAATQVGITIVTTLASAIGGAQIEPIIAEWLRTMPLTARYAPQLSLLMLVARIGA